MKSEHASDFHPHGDYKIDDQLERAITGYLDRINSGESLDPAQILAENPKWGHEILESLEHFLKLGISSHDHTPLGTLGDYTLRRQIGRGGMGVVYEAWQNSMDRQVALKVLPSGIAADDKAFHRFMREAKTAGRLNHQNVVSVYGMGVEQNTPYYSMEMVEGETLAKVLAKIKEADDETETPFGKKGQQQFYLNIAAAFADVADGLQHAHSRGVIHRDIKPSNLILDSEGRLRILDFGIARLEGQESLTISGDLVGTPLYMSPEQARQKKIPVDHRTDVYSLGATMYEMLTGRPPFKGKDHQDTLSQIIERDPTEPRKIHPRVPRDLETVVLKCLRKDPADRYGTAEALGQDFKRFVRGDPIEARPQGRWEKARRRLKRYRRHVFVGVALLVLCGISLWLAVERSKTRREKELAEYPQKVLNAAVMMAEGQFSLQIAPASGSASIGLPGTFRLEAVTPDDLRQLLHDESLRPVREAARALERLTGNLPRQRDGHYHLARAYRILARPELVMVELSRTLEIDPNFVPAEILRRELDAELSESNPDQLTLPPPAASGKSGKLWPTAGRWGKLWLAARMAERRRQWLAAVAAYSQLINWSQRNEEPYIGFLVEAYLRSAALRIQLGDYPGAYQDLGSARFIVPTSLERELLLAKAYYGDGQKKRARRVFQRLRKQNQENREELQLWIAATYASLGEYQEALGWADQLEKPSIRERLKSHLFLRLADWSGAAEAGRRAVEADPRNLPAYLLLGSALRHILFDDRAMDESLVLEFLECARESVELAPESQYAKFLQRVAREVAQRYLTCFSSKRPMSAQNPSMEAILDLVLAEKPARPASIIDDFIADPDPFDGIPVSWEPIFYCTTSSCTFTPTEQGLEVTNTAFDAGLLTEEVFAGEVWVEGRGTFNGGYRGNGHLFVGAHLENTTVSGYYGSITSRGEIHLSKFTNGSPKGPVGHAGFMPDLTAELALEIHVAEGRNEPGAWVVEFRVWRPAEEGRPDPQLIMVDRHNPCTNGQAAFGCNLRKSPIPARFHSVTIKNAPCGISFRRGDSNSDNALSIEDAVFILGDLFTDGAIPTCLDAADANDDGALDIGDGISILRHLFASGLSIPPPALDCGPDPTPDNLMCDSYEGCEGS